ncbi:MAG TPA: D-alanine--D-alanine ligase family protein [Microthrixaceae bacterium]|nr:D-alanine--D-alanine ligase family protein [Microthrixaceae bacterium]
MPLPTRVRLVVLFGGRSAEHDISRVSASHVLRAVDSNRYEVHPVGIRRDGTWVDASDSMAQIAATATGEPVSPLSVDGAPIDPTRVLSGSADGLTTVVLPILHGPNGEDGTIQGLLEMLDIPYVGSGVLGSSVSMDKALAKSVLTAHGIAQPEWVEVRACDFAPAAGGSDASDDLLTGLLETLGEVVFVKPANMGSSVGVSRAEGMDELRAALELAFAYDDFAVVEEAITARELEVGVIGNLNPRASVVGEVIPAAEFYDFEDKYSDGAAKTVIPADIDPNLADEIRTVALRTYKALRAEGLARVDVFLEADSPGRPGRGILVNEINTIPGFTPISMYPMLWRESGLDYPALIDELVELALDRHERRSRYRTDVQARATEMNP